MADQPAATPAEDKQCRICLDGADPLLGRLIRPCLCKGSMSYVHTGCLKRWRDSSASKNFFSCPVCHYQYRLERTRVVGLATNPVVLGALTSIFFTTLVLCASYVTTYLFGDLGESSLPSSSYYSYSFYISPYDVGKDLVRAALRILQEQSGFMFDEDILFTASTTPTAIPFIEKSSPGIIKRFVRRFLLGLPMVGAISIVQVLISLPIIGPMHWLARWRGNRGNRRGNSRDVAALVVILVLLAGAARALWKVYQFTQKQTRRLLMLVEDQILEV